jgi:predicted aspartyl protease
LSVVLLIVVGFSGELRAQELYRWVDDKGIVHFADNLHSVPEKYRGGAEKRSIPPSRETPTLTPQGDAGPTRELGLRHPEVPFIQRGKQILVEGIINQRVPVDLLVDAGTTITTIPASVGARLGIDLSKGLPLRLQENRGVVSGRLVTVDSLRVGEVEINDFEIAISEYSPSGLGFLGSDFLGRFHVHVDYKSNRLELAPGEGPYDGRPPEWWQERFRFYRVLKQTYEKLIRKGRADLQGLNELSWHEDAENTVDLHKQILNEIKTYEGYLRVVTQKIDELDRRASDAAVPRNFRE